MTARELVRAGKRVTILEARDRCGGRIYPLPPEEFGYPAEGGAEFVHGAAPVTRALMREARVTLQPRGGTRWSTRAGALSPDSPPVPHAGRFYQALREVKVGSADCRLPGTNFSGRQYDALRRSITRTVEGYDAADPRRASTFAIRDEWMVREEGEHGRIAQGYGALVEYLLAECIRLGAAIHFEEAKVTAVDECSGELPHDAATAPRSRAMPPGSRGAAPASRRDLASRRWRVSAPRPLPISASATSSRYCCVLRRHGGLITTDEI